MTTSTKWVQEFHTDLPSTPLSYLVGSIAIKFAASWLQYGCSTSSLISTFQGKGERQEKIMWLVSALGMQKFPQKSLAVFYLYLISQIVVQGDPYLKGCLGKLVFLLDTLSPQAKSEFCFLRKKGKWILKWQIAISIHDYCRFLNRKLS